MRREEEALEAVRHVLDGKVRDAVPRSLGIHGVDGTEVLLQTGIPGRHLVAETASGRLRPSALAKQIELVLDWCLTMQAASCRMTIVDDARSLADWSRSPPTVWRPEQGPQGRIAA
jgi:hypothetical protein